MQYDAIIIGAGYSGLAAALKLKKAGKNVLVLEARDRVGGRVYSKQLDEKTLVDFGGAWIGPMQDRVYALLEEYGIETFESYDSGRSTLWFDNGKLTTYEGSTPPLPPKALSQLNRAVNKIGKLSKTINANEPWAAEKAHKWDSMSLHTWMDNNLTSRKAREWFKITAESIWAADPNELSFLHALFYIQSSGDTETLKYATSDAQAERITGGAQQLALQIAEALAGHIRLSEPVISVRQHKKSVQVTTVAGTYKAAKVIVAIPPLLIPKINFSPQLPVNKRQLYERTPMGSVVKTFAVYEKPFWREKELSGMAVTNNGYTTVTFDNSPEDGSRGILMGFVLANRAKKFINLPEKERREHTIAAFVKIFGEEARDPLFYIDKSWTDEEFSGGCYAGFMPTGVWSSVGHEIRTVFGNIHWAGTETSAEWNGYMEGAIRAGERAADEILGDSTSSKK